MSPFPRYHKWFAKIRESWSFSLHFLLVIQGGGREGGSKGGKSGKEGATRVEDKGKWLSRSSSFFFFSGIKERESLDDARASFEVNRDVASVCTGQPSCVSLALHLLKNRYLIGCFVLKWTRSLSKARTSLRFDEWRLRVSFYFILLFPFFFYFFARIGVVTSSALIMEREFNLLKDA